MAETYINNWGPVVVRRSNIVQIGKAIRDLSVVAKMGI